MSCHSMNFDGLSQVKVLLSDTLSSESVSAPCLVVITITPFAAREP